MKTPDINAILRKRPVGCKYGAPMGAKNQFRDPTQPLYVQRVQMVDGDYAPDGTYFGGYPSESLWCGFDVEGANRVYVRANDRAGALSAILEDYPEAVFVKPAALTA